MALGKVLAYKRLNFFADFILSDKHILLVFFSFDSTDEFSNFSNKINSKS